MTDEANEQERRLGRLEHRVEKNEAIANEDKETRRAEMTAMKSDLAESLARNEAAAARAEAANKDGLARLEAVVSADRVAAERRDKDLHKFISVMFFGATGIIVGSVGVAAGLLGLFLGSGG